MPRHLHAVDQPRLKSVTVAPSILRVDVPRQEARCLLAAEKLVRNQRIRESGEVVHRRITAAHWAANDELVTRFGFLPGGIPTTWVHARAGGWCVCITERRFTIRVELVAGVHQAEGTEDLLFDYGCKRTPCPSFDDRAQQKEVGVA